MEQAGLGEHREHYHGPNLKASLKSTLGKCWVHRVKTYRERAAAATTINQNVQ